MLRPGIRRLSALALTVFAVFGAWPLMSGAQLSGPFTPAPVPARREARIGVVNLPATLNLADELEGTTPLIARQVFDTLVQYKDSSTDVEPALATRWTTSRDGLTWSFFLREGVRFHDGTLLTAGEVAASFTRFLRADPPSVVWSALLRGSPGVVKDVRASDARTVQFALAQPYAPLLTALAHPGLGVVKAVTGRDGGARFVGTGPYRIADASQGRLALEAAAGHWSGGPRSDRLVILEVATDEHAEAEFDQRALDIWFPPGPPRRAEGVLSAPGLQVGYLAFQTEKEPFSRKKIRQAVAAALDPAIVGLGLGRVAVPLPSFLPIGVWGRREGSPILGGTRQTVTTLLTEGAWPRGFVPTLLVPDETEPVNLPQLAEGLRRMLQAVDIPIRIRVEPPAAARTLREAGQHDLALAEAAVTGGDPHLFLYPLSTSEGAGPGTRRLNFSFYRNPRLDDVLIRASQLSVRTERERLYRRAQGMLADEMPWLPLYVRLVWAVARPEVRGLRLHPTGFHRLTTVTREGVIGGLP